MSGSQPQHLGSADQILVLTKSSTKSSYSSTVEPVAKSVQSVPGSTRTDFSITAPAGVDVQQNDDRSFTVTIGMPFQLDIGRSIEKTKQPHLEEPFSSKHNITFQKEDAVQQKQQPQPQQVDDSEQSSPPVLRTKQLERILSEGSGSEPSTPSSTDGGPPRSGSKVNDDQSLNHSITQSINQSINQPVNQSFNQSIIQSINQSHSN